MQSECITSCNCGFIIWDTERSNTNSHLYTPQSNYKHWLLSFYWSVFVEHVPKMSLDRWHLTYILPYITYQIYTPKWKSAGCLYRCIDFPHVTCVGVRILWRVQNHILRTVKMTVNVLWNLLLQVLLEWKLNNKNRLPLSAPLVYSCFCILQIFHFHQK